MKAVSDRSETELIYTTYEKFPKGLPNIEPGIYFIGYNMNQYRNERLLTPAEFVQYKEEWMNHHDPTRTRRETKIPTWTWPETKNAYFVRAKFAKLGTDAAINSLEQQVAHI